MPEVIPTPTDTPTPITDNIVDVIIVIGQSNAAGSQSDFSNNYIADPLVNAYNGTSFPLYQPNTFTGFEAGQATGHWAAELSYVQHWRYANPGRKMVVLRFTNGGTQLAPFAAGNDWAPTSAGELFDQAGTFVSNALASLRAGGASPRIRLLWWQQGESDCTAALASGYGDRLGTFIAALRDPSGRFAIPATAPIAIGRLSSRYTGCDNATRALVRGGQASVSAADIGGPQVLVDDDDLPLEADKTHLTRVSQLVLGDRLWAVDQRTYAEATGF